MYDTFDRWIISYIAIERLLKYCDERWWNRDKEIEGMKTELTNDITKSLEKFAEKFSEKLKQAESNVGDKYTGESEK